MAVPNGPGGFLCSEPGNVDLEVCQRERRCADADDRVRRPRRALGQPGRGRVLLHHHGDVLRQLHVERRIQNRSLPVVTTVDRIHPADKPYPGVVAVLVDEHRHDSRVRLVGRVDPIDGRYHWQGTILDATFDVKLPQDVTVVVQEHAAAARLTERTPWSTYSVVGVGAPPFALADLEVDVPRL